MGRSHVGEPGSSVSRTHTSGVPPSGVTCITRIIHATWRFPRAAGLRRTFESRSRDAIVLRAVEALFVA